jgi:dihydroneopterin aldolase
MAKDKISITGIKAFGFHGVLDHERKNGQDFIADIEFTYKTDKATKTDDIKFAIDYGLVAQLVKSLIEGKPQNLIEKLADDIAKTLLKSFKIDAVKVVLHKPHAPVDMKFSDISVSVERKK